jgi:hypothetical protein
MDPSFLSQRSPCRFIVSSSVRSRDDLGKVKAGIAKMMGSRSKRLLGFAVVSEHSLRRQMVWNGEKIEEHRGQIAR